MDVLRARQLINLAGGDVSVREDLRKKFPYKIDRCVFFRFVYSLLRTNLPFTGEGWAKNGEGFVSGAIMVGDTIVAHPECVVLLDGVYCDRPLNDILRSAVLGNWASRLRGEHSHIRVSVE